METTMQIKSRCMAIVTTTENKKPHQTGAVIKKSKAREKNHAATKVFANVRVIPATAPPRYSLPTLLHSTFLNQKRNIFVFPARLRQQECISA
jgi:hypothetical protein